MNEERKQCDVLVVGGGVAGMMAAIRAQEMGARVILAEKSNTMRSGGGGMGVDHFFSYWPHHHGDFETFLKELTIGQQAPTWAMKDKEYIRFMFEISADIVKIWEKWGIPVKYHGKYYFAGHCFPGQKPSWLKISGLNMKPVMTEQALKQGVEIMNRVMVFDTLKDKKGKLVGAIGINTREDKVYVFDAKAVILTTGCVSGLYPAPGRAGDFNRAFPILQSGDGRIMAYRAGAELADLELTRRHAGPKFFARAGQASWVGVLRDRNGKAVGPFLEKPSALYGDMTVEVNKEIFEQYKKSGRGPIYMDMNGISEEDYREMLHYLKHQGNIAVLDNLVAQGVKANKAAIEFTTFEHAVATGVLYNHKGETAVQGLYAAGDEYMAGLGASAIIGWSAGENAAQFASSAPSVNAEGARSQIRAHEDLIKEFRTRKVGAKWTEAYGAVQEVAEDYCGGIRSQLSLEAGLDIMRRFRKLALENLKAESAHEIVYCLQALNLFDMEELLLISANDRKETRGLHVRADYTLTNPTLGGKHHVIRQVDGKPALGWKNAR
jgi:succinate dehydrogenase/fumarate reductase flavoprotein subunit